MPSFLETVKNRYGTTEPVATVHHLPPRDFTGDISPYASAALNRELSDMANALPGGRNHQLNKSAFSLSQLIAGGELPHTLVHEQLTQAALAAGLTATEITATLRSGLKAGSEHPRETPPPTPLPDVTTIKNPNTPTTDTTTREPTEPEGINDRIQSDELTDADREYLQALTRHRALTAEIERQRTQRDARRHLDDEEHLKQFRAPTYRHTLTEELLIPDDPVSYTIDRLLPKGGNVLLTAQFKTGKTTFVNHLAKCLADSEPFLGEYDVSLLTGGRVGMFNYEVDDHQYRRWLRESNIHNTDAISILNLRGYRLPAVVPRVEDWIVNWLQEHEIKVWVVDPFARAFVGSGTSENDNTEVGRFLDTLDVIKERAGVTDLILPTHTGRAEFEQGEERARGATRLDDWADVRWFLTKDDDDTRFFRATGRDVDIPEQKLSFNESDRSLRIGGGDRAWEKKRAGENRVVDHVTANPGCSTRSIYAALRQGGLKGKDGVLQGHIDSAVFGHRIVLRPGETNGAANRYYPLEATVIGGAE